MTSSETARHIIGAKYTVSARLATTGSSRLYSAIEADTGRPVALREYAPAGDSGEVLSRLTRTYAVASRFVADLIDAGRAEDGAGIFVVHPFFKGESLLQRLDRKGRLPAAEAAALASRILKGLGSMHARGVPHAALRPSRVFLEKTAEEGWHVKLLGAAVESVNREDAARHIEVYRYCPPEWIDGAEWDLRGDVWVVGALLYLCLTSQPAILGGTVDEIGRRARTGEIAQLKDVSERFPPELEPLIASCLAPDPAKRPESATVVLDQLLAIFPEQEAPRSATAVQNHWTRGGVVGAARAPGLTDIRGRRERSARRDSRDAAIIGAAVAIAGLGVGSALLLRRSSSTVESTRTLPSSREPAVPVANAPLPPLLAQAPTPDAAPPPSTVAPPVPSTDSHPTTGSATPSTNPNPHVHSNVRNVAVTPSTTAAPPSEVAGTGNGVLDFRSAAECALVVDGATRGAVSRARFVLPPGQHLLTCHSRTRTERLVIRIHAEHVTNVYLNTLGETEVSTEAAPQGL